MAIRRLPVHRRARLLTRANFGSLKKSALNRTRRTHRMPCPESTHASESKAMAFGSYGGMCYHYGTVHRRRQKKVWDFCQIDDAARGLLQAAMKQMHMSARGFHRILKVSRTVADLAAADTIGVAQLAEAL